MSPALTSRLTAQAALLFPSLKCLQPPAASLSGSCSAGEQMAFPRFLSPLVKSLSSSKRRHQLPVVLRATPPPPLSPSPFWVEWGSAGAPLRRSRPLHHGRSGILGNLSVLRCDLCFLRGGRYTHSHAQVRGEPLPADAPQCHN